MSDPLLPPDLAALEQLLAGRSRSGPPPELCPRVLTATRAVLHPRPASQRIGIAAVGVVAAGINLAMSLGTNTDWGIAPAAVSEPTAVTTARLRALAPELSEAELRRQAILVRAAESLTPTLNFTPSRERDQWDVH